MADLTRARILGDEPAKSAGVVHDAELAPAGAAEGVEIGWEGGGRGADVSSDVSGRRKEEVAGRHVDDVVVRMTGGIHVDGWWWRESDVEGGER